MSVRAALGVAGAVMVLGVLAVPSPALAAAGGGIVYTRSNNVWITSSDGSNQRQLTFNGTASSPWLDPTMSSRGAVFAIRNEQYTLGGRANQRGTIVRMNQGGTITGRITPPQVDSRNDGVTRSLGLTAIAASPSGERIAYQHAWLCPDPVHPSVETVCSVTDVAWADGSDTASVGHLASLRFMETPSWANETTLLLSKRALGISYYRYGSDLGGGEPRPWFGYTGVDFRHDADLGPRRLAIVGRFSKPQGMVDGLQLLEVDARLPAKPTPKCLLTGPNGAYQDPSWSADGSSLAWAESDSDTAAPEPSGEGVWVAEVGYFAAGCAVTTVGGQTPIVPDGETPEWGARFEAAARVQKRSLVYLAGARSNNDVKIVAAGGAYSMADHHGHAIAPGGHCTRFTTAAVACTPSSLGTIVAWGYDGDDRLAALVAVPTALKGGAGNDTLVGGSRTDRIAGGRGRDVMAGNAGNDVIDARDGSADRVNCGPGRDTVFADANDVVRNCERVHR